MKPTIPAPVRGAVLVDLALALIVLSLAMAIIADEDGGLIDGRHVLAVVLVTVLIIRTTRAARR